MAKAIGDHIIWGGQVYSISIPDDLTQEQQAQARKNLNVRAATDTGVAVSLELDISPSDWTDNAFTATISGVKEASSLLISPADASAADFITCGVSATEQSDEAVTFICETVPTDTITVQILIL